MTTTAPFRFTYYAPACDPSNAASKAPKSSEAGYASTLLPATPEHPANVVSSLCSDGRHRPALDIDVPCRVVPSSTPGHVHLYFDETALTWEQYVRLLTALGDAGILEQGYVRASIERGQSVLRLPGVSK